MGDNRQIADNWSKEQTLVLIRELQKHPSLYNPMDINYTNKTHRNEKIMLVWDEMIKHKTNVTAHGIKKKIRTLQSQLSKEKTRAENSTADVYEPKLWCYNELFFLKHDVSSNSEDVEEVGEPSSSNIDLSNISELDGSEDEEYWIKSEIVTEKNTERNSSEQQNPALDAHDYAKQLVEHIPIEEPDSNKKVFCKYLLSELKQIKLEDTFDSLKLEILQLVTKKIKEERRMLP